MKFYGQWNPPVDKILYESYFKNTCGKIFIECGAFDGIRQSSCKFFEEFMDWKGVNIEPVPYIYKKLCKNRPKAINLNLALSNSIGKAKFTQPISARPEIGRNFGNGSLTLDKQRYNKLKRNKCTFEKYIVETTTYNKLIDSLQLKNIDLFVLDVEGHELEVIEGMVDCNILPYIICAEHNQAGVRNLDTALKNLNYRLDKRVFNNSYYIKS